MGLFRKKEENDPGKGLQFGQGENRFTKAKIHYPTSIGDLIKELEVGEEEFQIPIECYCVELYGFDPSGRKTQGSIWFAKELLTEEEFEDRFPNYELDPSKAFGDSFKKGERTILLTANNLVRLGPPGCNPKVVPNAIPGGTLKLTKEVQKGVAAPLDEVAPPFKKFLAERVHETRKGSYTVEEIQKALIFDEQSRLWRRTFVFYGEDDLGGPGSVEANPWMMYPGEKYGELVVLKRIPGNLVKVEMEHTELMEDLIALLSLDATEAPEADKEELEDVLEEWREAFEEGIDLPAPKPVVNPLSKSIWGLS